MQESTTQFRLESEMLHPLVASIPSLFHFRTGQRTRVLVEPMIGAVIPDIVIGVWSGDLPRLHVLNSVSRHILAWLSEKKVALQETQMCDELLLSKTAASSAMTLLKRVGAVDRLESGEVELRREFEYSVSLKLVAIEVKLKRWREALEQAITYQDFCDESYVVLDGNQIKLSGEIVEAFVSQGIGLFLQRANRVKKVIKAAPRCAPARFSDRLIVCGKLAKSGPYCLA